MKLSILLGRFYKPLFFRISTFVLLISGFIFPLGWFQPVHNPSASDVYIQASSGIFAADHRLHLQSLSTDTPTVTPYPTYTPYPTNTPYPTYTPLVSSTPVPVRSLVINEVAWMGDRVSSDAEWIEIYNATSYPVDLTGWRLRVKDDPSFVIIFDNQTIPGNSFYILQRSTIYPINIGSALSQIYTGRTLNDTGEHLQLLDPHGNVVDTANNQNGVWPAGSKSTFCTMERAGYNISDIPANWITNTGVITNGTDANGNPLCGTPNLTNWAYSVTPTPTYTSTATRTRTATSTRTPTRTPTVTNTPTLTPNPYNTPSVVVLNEFLVQPREDLNGDGKVDTGDEFIEIINLGSVKISLSNWQLDDQPGDSDAYVFGENESINGNSKLTFFRSQTGILLSSGGDSVRLLKSNGLVSDAFTYTINRAPGLSWCRFPDGGQKWIFGCEPTYGQSNRKAQLVFAGIPIPAICTSNSLPGAVIAAECGVSDLSAGASLFEGFSPTYPLFINVGADLCILE